MQIRKFQLKAFLFGLAAVLCSCTQSTVEKGAVCLRLGDYRMAEQFFRAGLERNPADIDARIGLGKALLQRIVDRPADTVTWRDALTQLEAARSLAPGRADLIALLSEVWSEHSRSLLVRRDTLGALEALSRSIEYGPDNADAINLAGILYFRRGNMREARALFLRALDADSMHSSALFNLGMACWQEEDWKGAHGAWMKALSISPDDSDALYWFARAEKRLREAR